MSIKEKLAELRSAMLQAGISAWIVPGTDPHMNEYLPAYWAERKFISGFTGSAGKVVITQEQAGLWTDGRYFIQASEQLAEGGLQLFKEGIAGTPSISEYICSKLKAGDKVGINGLIISENTYTNYKKELTTKDIDLVTELDLISPIWDKRPPLSDAPLFTLADDITGESTTSKLTRLRSAMGNADAALFNMLDEVAWLYNLRGSDVKCNPVVMAYAWVEKDSALLFVDENKVNENDRATFSHYGISLQSYSKITETLAQRSIGMKVITDYNKTNHTIIAAMTQAKVINEPSWITLQKAQKNTTELAGTLQAMTKDGVALTQFFMWLEKTLETHTPDEYEIGQKVAEYHAKQSNYAGESFDPIVGYNANSAITHYSAPKEGSQKVKAEGLLLLDLGAQFTHGTTDITRTIALGKVSDEMIHNFTLVLKGHIALGTALFPKGTRGAQLDALARIALWNEGKDYQHGTGHGVGHFLNVHEGPQNIRKDENNTPLLTGMILSNEPGYYLEGAYGIRIENLVTVIEHNDDFLKFKTLTLCPIEKRLIDVTMLSEKELSWLNQYHQNVYEQLSPLLNDDETQWLKDKTSPLHL